MEKTKKRGRVCAIDERRVGGKWKVIPMRLGAISYVCNNEAHTRTTSIEIVFVITFTTKNTFKKILTFNGCLGGGGGGRGRVRQKSVA